MSEDVRHEIVPGLVGFLTQGKTAVDAFIGHIRVIFAFLEDAFWEERLDYFIKTEEAEADEKRGSFELGEQDGDPAMVAGFFKAME